MTSADPSTNIVPCRSLQNIQRWMQAVIINPDGVENGATSEAAHQALPTETPSIDDLILPSNALSSQRRLEVYANAYYARLLECLRDEYPALTKLLGEDTFNAFGFEYLQQHPSQSYTLADLGHAFPAFLAENRAAATGGDSESQNTESTDESWVDLMIDLAIVERTYSEVFSGPGIEKSETLRADAVAAIPPAQVGSIRLVVAPCVRLVRLNTMAHEFAIAVRKGTASTDQLPDAVPTCLVITRLNYVVRTIKVEHEEFQLLEHLIKGATLEEAIERLAEHSPMTDDQWTDQLGLWFEKWAADRLFCGINLH